MSIRPGVDTVEMLMFQDLTPFHQLVLPEKNSSSVS
jgi:hypothetical protein